MLVAEYLIKNTLYNVESGEQRIAFIVGEMIILGPNDNSSLKVLSTLSSTTSMALK